MGLSLAEPVPAAIEPEVQAPALEALLAMLDAQGYQFVTPTPATHARVVGRRAGETARDLRDIFGWNLPFADGLVPLALHTMLHDTGLLADEGELCRAKVRASRVHGLLFVHSAYPTEEADAVFLGPDSYRFADLVAGCMGELRPGARVLDFGAGAGVGGIIVAKGRDVALTLADVNRRALRFAAVNAANAGVHAELAEADRVEQLDGSFDLILMNPPYMMDAAGRAYRDGGDLHGARLSLDWTLAAMEKLAPGGQLILYTGVAIVDGQDALRDRLEAALGQGFRMHYRELDPDVFGEELETPAYRDVERIAVVGACITRA